LESWAGAHDGYKKLTDVDRASGPRLGVEAASVAPNAQMIILLTPFCIKVGCNQVCYLACHLRSAVQWRRIDGRCCSTKDACRTADFDGSRTDSDAASTHVEGRRRLRRSEREQQEGSRRASRPSHGCVEERVEASPKLYC